jgi:hypothetical protein
VLIAEGQPGQLVPMTHDRVWRVDQTPPAAADTVAHVAILGRPECIVKAAKIIEYGTRHRKVIGREEDGVIRAPVVIPLNRIGDHLAGGRTQVAR